MSPTSLPSSRQDSEGRMTGRHVLWMILGFFAIVFGVNGVLLWQALATHSGLVANEPYRKGLAYNDRIAAGERQHDLQWIESLNYDAARHVTLQLTDRARRPVTRLEVIGSLGRPATNRDDLRLAFTEVAPGVYVASPGKIDPGAWRIDIEARQASDGKASDAIIYRLRRRLWLTP